MPTPIHEVPENELIAGLSQLAGTIDLPVDPLELRAAAQQALREVPADTPDRWLALLRHAGEVFGLRVETIRASVAELCRPLGPHSFPLLPRRLVPPAR